jgi:NADH:ubiquinone oxidoreductase subunit
VITIGTLLYTLFKGELVGVDEFGNRYYRGRGRSRYGRERRWVLFKGKAEASRVPPEWHAWLHHTAAEPLTQIDAVARPWRKPHRPNPTGTDGAYRPPGHQLRGGRRARATGDYEPWRPQ